MMCVDRWLQWRALLKRKIEEMKGSLDVDYGF